MSIRPRAPFAAPLLAALATATIARAAPLDVRAPRECAGAATLERAVAAYAGRPVPLDDVSLSIRQEPATWHARLRTAHGERELEAESCAAAIDAAALVLALAAEPEAAASRGDETPRAAEASLASDAAVTAGAGAAAPEPPRAPADRRSAAADRARPTTVDAPSGHDEDARVGLSAGVLGEVGLLPAPSLGARLALGFAWRAWRVELAGVALLPRRADLGAEVERAADIGWWAGQLVACRRLFGALDACAGPELGLLHGEGEGVDAPRSADGTWAAVTLGSLWNSPWSTPPGPWSWQVGTSAALAVVRPEFGFDGLGVLHRPSAISGRLWLALAWR